MEVSIHSLLEGATRATGTVAVVDVFRAFTTAAVALASGASGIIMVSTVEEALALDLVVSSLATVIAHRARNTQRGSTLEEKAYSNSRGGGCHSPCLPLSPAQESPCPL